MYVSSPKKTHVKPPKNRTPAERRYTAEALASTANLMKYQAATNRITPSKVSIQHINFFELLQLCIRLHHTDISNIAMQKAQPHHPQARFRLNIRICRIQVTISLKADPGINVDVPGIFVSFSACLSEYPSSINSAA